jgi:hypothetical protein
MTVMNEIHRVALFITNDSKHPSHRKVKIKADGIPGAIWVDSGEDYEDLATKWIAMIMDWPEHLVYAYNVNGASA